MRTKGAGPFSHLRLKARVCKRSAQKSRRSRAAVWLWLCSTSALRRAAFDGAAAGGSGRSLRVGLALQSTPALPKAVDCERKTISKKPAVEDGGHCDNPVGERSFESLFGVSGRRGHPRKQPSGAHPRLGLGLTALVEAFQTFAGEASLAMSQRQRTQRSRGEELRAGVAWPKPRFSDRLAGARGERLRSANFATASWRWNASCGGRAWVPQ